MVYTMTDLRSSCDEIPVMFLSIYCRRVLTSTPISTIRSVWWCHVLVLKYTNFRSPPPSRTIFSELPFRVCRNFRAPLNIFILPPCHIKWTFPKHWFDVPLGSCIDLFLFHSSLKDKNSRGRVKFSTFLCFQEMGLESTRWDLVWSYSWVNSVCWHLYWLLQHNWCPCLRILQQSIS